MPTLPIQLELSCLFYLLLVYWLLRCLLCLFSWNWAAYSAYCLFIFYWDAYSAYSVGTELPILPTACKLATDQPILHCKIFCWPYVIPNYHPIKLVKKERGERKEKYNTYSIKCHFFFSFCTKDAVSFVWVSKDKTCNKTYVTSEGSDQPAHQHYQPAHQHWVWSVFTDHLCHLQPPHYPKRDEGVPLPYWVDVLANVSLCQSQMSYCRFCHALARTINIQWLPEHIKVHILWSFQSYFL